VLQARTQEEAKEWIFALDPCRPMEEALHQSRAEYDTLRGELEKKDETISDLLGYLDKANDKSREQGETVQQLRKECSILRSELGQKNDTVRNLSSSLDQANKKFRALEADLQRQLTKKTDIIAELYRSLDQATEKVHTLEESLHCKLDYKDRLFSSCRGPSKMPPAKSPIYKLSKSGKTQNSWILKRQTIACGRRFWIFGLSKYAELENWKTLKKQNRRSATFSKKLQACMLPKLGKPKKWNYDHQK